MDEDNSKTRGALGKAVAKQAKRVHREYAAKEKADLIVAEGETVLLSYENQRFQAAYKELRPQSADEVRTIMGLSAEVAEHAGGSSDCGCRKTARVVGAADLESDDESVRGRAMSLTRASMRRFVMGTTASVSQMAVFDRYIQLTKPIMHVIFLQDIVVHNGATLTVAGNTHAVYARKIRIHGTGRIVCQGPTTFNCTSLEGDYHQLHAVLPRVAIQPA